MYSKHSALADSAGRFTCSCGTTLTLPEEPKETAWWKLRNRLGESLVGGLVGALLFGVFSIGLRHGQWFFGVSASAFAGFVVGALFGDRFLEWLSEDKRP
jgi:hypothetical protein